MRFKNLLSSLIVLFSVSTFSQMSHALILYNYTAFYQDGSMLEVDLKGYDYGVGEHFALPQADGPYEGFDTYFTPANHRLWQGPKRVASWITVSVHSKAYLNA